MKTQTAHQHFTQFLKQKNFRNTPERFEVLDAILAHKGHFDADELFLKLKSSGSKVSRATVYNTLEKLTHSGMVSRYRFGEKLARYELAFGSEMHHHIICQKCGKIEEFCDKRVDRLARDAAQSMGYELRDHVLYIYGLCKKCLKAKTDGNKNEKT